MRLCGAVEVHRVRWMEMEEAVVVVVLGHKHQTVVLITRPCLFPNASIFVVLTFMPGQMHWSFPMKQANSLGSSEAPIRMMAQGTHSSPLTRLA